MEDIFRMKILNNYFTSSDPPHDISKQPVDSIFT